MSYAEHRFIKSSKFKNLCSFRVYETRQSTEILDSGARFFAFLDDSSLKSGEMVTETKQKSGLTDQSRELDCVFNFSPVLFNALNDRKFVKFSYQSRPFYPVSWAVPSENQKYLTIKLRETSHGK